MTPRVSVLMPTYGQAAFICRAIDSLCDQTLTDWELIIIDDASPDRTAEMVRPFLSDPRISYHRLAENSGRGAALNVGLQHSQAPLIAYLPSDDVYYSTHLASLVDCLADNPEAVLAFSGVRYHYNRTAPGIIPVNDYGLQMVQVVHRRTEDCWLERQELVSDDLDRLYWSKLREHGAFVGSEQVTCEWVQHPDQLHKLLREPIGGINTYRRKFGITHPLRFHTTQGNLIDETAHYRRFRERPDTPPAPDALKILLVGELAYNSERVLALEELGHRLYGLWMPDPYWYNTVGPLPFGHVTDLPADDWQAALRRLQPDIIYALLNWQAVPFVREVMNAAGDIPVVWHFKEGPFICLEKGTWPALMEIHQRAAGQIFCSPETKAWYETVMPGITRNSPALILDGDLPKQDWFAAERSPRLSDQDGEFHTVVPGRPIGLHPHNVAELAAEGIHLHFYGNFTQGQWVEWIDKCQRLAPGYLHLHDQVDQDRWVTEFSRYDAGWLHWLKSENGGDLRRANWDDLNYPARMTTLAVAGLPLLQYDNHDAAVATQSLVRDLDIGLFFTSMAQLREQLADKEQMSQIRDNVWRQRSRFTFDHHAGGLIDFFRQVIENQS